MGSSGRILSPAGDVEDFSRAPVDRYVTGPRWLVFSRTEFSGIVLWGQVDADVIHHLATFLPSRCLRAPHPSLLDMRLVDSIDATALEVRSEFLTEHLDKLSSFVTRLAVVHPPGLIAAIVAGLRAIAPPPCPEASFSDLDEALVWLGKEGERPLLDELDQLRSQAAGLTPVLRDLRTMLAARRRLQLREAARALGLSTRSLQRQLAAVGTSYQEELTLATVCLAQRLLLAPGANVAAVAFDVGCTSPQHLNTLFRKVVGETTTGWRDRQPTKSAK